MLLFVNCGLVLLVVQPVVGMPRDKRTVDPSPDHALMTRRSYGDLEELKANVTKLQDIIKDQEKKIQDLQAAHDRRVAFAAYISQEPRVYAARGAIVPFGGVITNIGYAFNPHSSAFTAPYNGIYVFFVGVDISESHAGVALRRNGRDVAHGDNDGGVNSHVSACVTIRLNARDVFTVNHYASRGYIDAGTESVFTGFLLA